MQELLLPWRDQEGPRKVHARLPQVPDGMLILHLGSLAADVMEAVKLLFSFHDSWSFVFRHLGPFKFLAPILFSQVPVTFATGAQSFDRSFAPSDTSRPNGLFDVSFE